jgi:DNA-binding Lrp family transcriptional regulator
MDKTDIILIMLLLNNSRMTNREIAEHLNLSINAVHKRIQSLKDLGVIRTFTAKPSMFASQSITIEIYGVSTAPTFEGLPEKLGKNMNIYWVALAGGNSVYIGAYLQRLSDLEPLVEFVSKEAQLPNPTVGIISLPAPSPASSFATNDIVLTSLDKKIISSLHYDSRKPIADIAEELGTSTKTIRRRLTHMIEHHLIELSLEWYPDASNDIFTVLHLRLKPTVDKKTLQNILGTYMPNLLFFWSFSNLTNELMAVVWTNTMKELKEIQERLSKENLFDAIIPNILYVGYIYETWRDALTEKT